MISLAVSTSQSPKSQGHWYLRVSLNLDGGFPIIHLFMLEQLGRDEGIM